MSLFSAEQNEEKSGSSSTPKAAASSAKPRSKRISTYVLLALLIGGGTWGAIWYAGAAREDRLVDQVVESEELILALTPRLKGLNESVLNLSLPDHNSRDLFAAKVVVNGGKATAQQELRLGQGFIDRVDHFTNAKFYLVRGEFTGPGVFATEMGFDGLGRTSEGTWRSMHGNLQVTWRREGEAADGDGSADDGSAWRISAWEMGEPKTEDRESLMFQEVLDLAVPDAAVRADARSAIHEKHVVDYYDTGKAVGLPDSYAKFFRAWADNMHPGLSVVDFDNDGWDDLYVSRRWERNLLFHNQQDGTFREMAAEVGLNLNGVTTSAIFADFDNDGDQDVFLGRSLQRSMYLANENGKYVNQPLEGMPYFVTSVSSADYNGDGLLDVYLCTYAIPDVDLKTREEAAEYFPREVVDKLWDKIGSADLSARYLDLSGPPNLLLKNMGNGKFIEAPESEQVELWRTSLQATWADYDDDGDPDLYVANDYSPDALFRNDGTAGFVEITREAGGEAMMGLGMGASFGDFDLDGKQDLYVSNMYSKAGRRITAQVEGIDPRFVRSAEGNLLFRKQDGDKFELVSSVEPPGMQVAKAGWSWGGQFTDLNNDGWLDIYVGSGFYTAPKAIASDVDL